MLAVPDCAGCPPSRPSPASGGRRRCHMQLQHSHVAASSSPIHGGGPRRGKASTNWQHLPPPFMGEDRGGGKRAPTGSIFLPHLWGRTEEGESEHKPKTGDNEHLPINLHATRTRASGRRSVSLPLPCPVPTFWWYAYRPLTDNLHPTADGISIRVGSDTDAPDGYPNQ